MLVPTNGMRAGVPTDVAASAEGWCGGFAADPMLELSVFPCGVMLGRLPSVGVERPTLAAAGTGVSRVRARSMAVSMEQGW